MNFNEFCVVGGFIELVLVCKEISWICVFVGRKKVVSDIFQVFV